jgi:hypothetical protein
MLCVERTFQFSVGLRSGTLLFPTEYSESAKRTKGKAVSLQKLLSHKQASRVNALFFFFRLLNDDVSFIFMTHCFYGEYFTIHRSNMRWANRKTCRYEELLDYEVLSFP